MILNRSLLVLSVVLVLGAMFVSVTQAQPPGGRRGGFGMGSRGSIVYLLGREEVQKELKLNEEQLARVNKLSEGAREEFAALRDIEDRQERTAKMTELTEQLDKKAREQLRDVLEREQMMRLFQIRMQVNSAVDNLSIQFLARRLELTDEQKETLANISKEMEAKRSELRAAMRDESQRSDAFQKFRELRDAADEQAVGVLTAEQKASYDEMKGEKFERPSRRGPR